MKVLHTKGSKVYHLIILRKGLKMGNDFKESRCGHMFNLSNNVVEEIDKSYAVVSLKLKLCKDCRRGKKSHGPPQPRPPCSPRPKHGLPPVGEAPPTPPCSKPACQHVFIKGECIKCHAAYVGSMDTDDVLFEQAVFKLEVESVKVTIAVYFKDGRVAEYSLEGIREDELYARAREHAHRIVNYGFRFDYKGGNCYVGPHEIDKVEIEGMPAGKYNVTWRNL